MKKIYSKVEPSLLLHIIVRLEDFKNNGQRNDVISVDNFLQCATLNMKEGVTFKPHKHIFKKRVYEKQISQESWVVIRGKVKCIFYDIDDTIIDEPILNEGDASFTLRGGHNYEALTDDTFVYEYKTGPYEGQALDKTFIK